MIVPVPGFHMSLLQYESVVRIGCFLGIFIVIAIMEIVVPRRPLTVKKSLRWLGNLSVQVVNGILPRLLFPILPVGMAALWTQKGWGLLNTVPLPVTATILLSLLALDMAIYAQHVLFHRIHFFWRIHRMHHTDMDLDLTSALRFSPAGNRDLPADQNGFGGCPRATRCCRPHFRSPSERHGHV
jgi:sterol desaturase/sphingolipid hydroxylase (fatty acid hydroxylase superfamily)